MNPQCRAWGDCKQACSVHTRSFMSISAGRCSAAALDGRGMMRFYTAWRSAAKRTTSGRSFSTMATTFVPARTALNSFENRFKHLVGFVAGIKAHQREP